MNKAILKPSEEIQFLEGMMYLRGFLEGANFTKTEELVNRFPEDFRLINSGKDEKDRDYVLLAYGNFRYSVIYSKFQRRLIINNDVLYLNPYSCELEEVILPRHLLNKPN
ncbi:MAG: hypothetical protein K2N35_14705 [Muribaculaceae bacterium]|nr:hypothetical protein [Muribaculaceae bacterium]